MANASITEPSVRPSAQSGSQSTAQPSANDVRVSGELIDFIKQSPSAFHAVRAIATRLDQAGFMYLPESETWQVRRGSTYYTTRNDSSVIAFKAGAALPKSGWHFQITASHSDAPTFKVKAMPELAGPANYVRLNVEAYGGAIDATWLDRPLGLAGRVLVRTERGIESRLAHFDEDLLLIPNVAIHMNRAVNSGFAFNRQVDLCPLFSAGALEAGAFGQMVAEKVGAAPADLLGFDLFLVNRQPACVWGAAREFVSSPKLDDLQCAFASLQAFLASDNENTVSVFACFDNEEVGSNTKQGAMSTLLADTLTRAHAALGGTEEGYLRAVAKSFLVSCDNAHALHPNHPELADEGNRPLLGGGVVIKEAANQKYTTDALSRAVFAELCQRAGVPVQTFANRSDKEGGSTLGNLSNMQVSMHAVDIGLPQLAMHSSFETASVRDTTFAIAALSEFYNATLEINGASEVLIR